MTPLQEDGFTPVSPGPRFVTVSSGQYHSVALTDTGDVYGIGLNRHAQLGPHLPRDSQMLEPVRMPSSLLWNGERVQRVVCGFMNTNVQTSSGRWLSVGAGFDEVRDLSAVTELANIGDVGTGFRHSVVLADSNQ